MLQFKHSLQLAAVTLAASLCAYAEVTLPTLLTEHTVLQRGIAVHIWGKATPGEAVSAEFRGETKSTTADTLGRWSVYLAPAEAGGPYELTVKGTNTITLKDVMVGDVWVASGQSNMDFLLNTAANGASEVAAAKYPNIRLLHVANTVSDYPLEDAASTGWAQCAPETAGRFSAVAYFFGRHLHEKLNVPIGLIHTAFGGTPVEAWTSLRGLSSDPMLMPVFAEWAKLMDAYPDLAIPYEKRLKDWDQAVAKAKADGTPPPRKPQQRSQAVPGGPWMPGGLYNGMIAPLTRFPIKGAIWYQGENNAYPERAVQYARQFQAMIRDWRRAWGQGDFPFLYVQLANWNAGPAWADLRESQRQTLSLANTGMAVTIDIGNPTNIHPTNKQDVGLRLALVARAIAYGEKQLEYSGPTFRQATREAASLRLWFDHAAGLTTKGGAVKGFEIAGEDRKFVPAEGRIEGTTVVVSNPAVPLPVYARYAWAANPENDLYNGEGLPASPFRTAE